MAFKRVNSSVCNRKRLQATKNFLYELSKTAHDYLEVSIFKFFFGT